MPPDSAGRRLRLRQQDFRKEILSLQAFLPRQADKQRRSLKPADRTPKVEITSAAVRYKAPENAEGHG
jgi:hypothetical protein